MDGRQQSRQPEPKASVAGHRGGMIEPKDQGQDPAVAKIAGRPSTGLTPRSSRITTPPAHRRRADSVTRAPARASNPQRARRTREMWSSIHADHCRAARPTASPTEQTRRRLAQQAHRPY